MAGSSAATLAKLYCPDAGGAFPNPLAGGAEAKLVPVAPPNGITFLEGPVWVASTGVLLMSEWNGGTHRILQLTPPQAVEVWLPVSRSNGLILAPEGDALFMVTETPAAGMARVELASKDVEPLVTSYSGESFIQPNDLAVRADGTLFFTDYQAGRLYRRGKDEQVTLVASQPHANGVGLAPDEHTLYLNSDARTLAYPLDAESELGAPRELSTQVKGADGLAIDCAGNVYVAQNEARSLLVLSPAGDELGELAVQSNAVTNAAFGGPDRKTLYVTTGNALYSIQLGIPGLPY
jgi:gluconolactonase